MALTKLVIFLMVLALFSSNATAMTVGEFINYKAMLMSANDPKSPLTLAEREKIHSMEKMSNLSLGGIIDGVISLNDISTLKGNNKIVCYPTGQKIDVSRFSDDIADYYDHIDRSKRAALDSQRLGYFVAAFLIKSFPCR